MKVYAGFITYNEASAKYLGDFLPSLRQSLESSGLEWQILAVDNSQSPANPNQPYLQQEQARGHFKLLASGTNLGFGKAYNLMFREALGAGADYFLVVNPDTVLDRDLVRLLAADLQGDEKAGAACPRILAWDFTNRQLTQMIDSDGVSISAAWRFSDARQGQPARPAVTSQVFGFSGAGVLLRLGALADIAFDNGDHLEYFDELFFMYKEDIDLSFRLRLAGWNILLEPQAKLWHDRSVRPQGQGWLEVWRNRANKSRQVKRWSFLNHWLLIIKFWPLDISLKIRLRIIAYQLAGLVFALLREPYLLSELSHLWQSLPAIRARRKRLKLRVSIAEIENFIYY